jgi:hypothetical protein
MSFNQRGSIALVAMALLGTSTMANADVALNLLFFGNSYTQNNNVPGFVSALAQADGYTAPLIVTDTAGGRTLDNHIHQATNLPQLNIHHPNIAGKLYDFAIVQGHSTEATVRQDPPNDFIPDTDTLAGLIRSSTAGANAALVLYETWAREPGHQFYQVGHSDYTFADPAQMQQQIRDNYNLARDGINQSAGDTIAMVAPAGDAFQAGGYASDLYRASPHDGSHASVKGSRLAGAVIYRAIYGETVSDIDYATLNGIQPIDAGEWSSIAALADSVTIIGIPEPASAALLTAGAVACLRRRSTPA